MTPLQKYRLRIIEKQIKVLLDEKSKELTDTFLDAIKELLNEYIS